MKRFVIGLIVLLMLAFTSTAQANIDNSWDMYGYLTGKKVSPILPKKVFKLVNKLEANKEKLALEYRDRADLEETVYNIYERTKDERYFDIYIVSSVIVCESRFNQYAFNRSDGGKGLMQVMSKYWREEMPWYRDTYKKDENIYAGITALNCLRASTKDTWKAVERYNGKCYKAKKYRQRVYRVYQTLKA